MAVLKVGVIGAGKNTKLHHIPKLAAIDGVSIVAVANRSIESATKVAREFNIARATDEWQSIINDPEIDAIVIGTWPYLHHTLVLAALQANKHVLCEARMAMDGKQAKEMLEASRQRPNLTTMIVPSPITFEYDATVSSIIKAGSLGNLLYIEVRSAAGSFPEASGSPLNWRQDIDLSGLNIMTLGIFYEALQRWIGDVSSVQALSKTVVGLRKDTDSGELKAVHVPDHLDILATHPSGANVHFLITSVLGAYQGLKSGFAIYGTKGSLQLDLVAKKLTVGLKTEGADAKGGSAGDVLFKEVHIPEEKRGSWRVEEEYVGAIRGQNKVSTTDFSKGLRYMEFTEAVTRSLQSGVRVQLPLLP